MDKRLKCKNLNSKTTKDNTGKNLPEIDLGNEFFDMTPKAQPTKAKIDKWDCIKLKRSSQQKKQSI